MSLCRNVDRPKLTPRASKADWRLSRDAVQVWLKGNGFARHGTPRHPPKEKRNEAALAEKVCFSRAATNQAQPWSARALSAPMRAGPGTIRSCS